MKKLRIDSRTISALGCFASMVLLTLLRIASTERIFGAQTSAFYRDLFSLLSQFIAFLIPFVVCTLLGARTDKVKLGTVYPLRLSPAFIPLIAGFCVCQYVVNFSATVVWDNVCKALSYRTFGPVAAPAQGFGQIALALLTSALLPAVAEEGVARGLMGKAVSDQPKRTQILLSALFFALLHQSFGRLGPTFLGGVWLFWLYYATGNVLAPIAVHFVNNAFSTMGASFGWTDAVHYALTNPLGIGIAIALTFLCISAMVGTIRLIERRSPIPTCTTASDKQNATVQRAAITAALVLGAAATLLSYIQGVTI